MNIAKHMEALFLGAALVCCSLAWAGPAQGVTEPGIILQDQQHTAPVSHNDTAVQTVTIVGHRPQ